MHINSAAAPQDNDLCLDLHLLDRPMELRMRVLAERATLADLVPAARTLADAMADLALAEHEARGRRITCRKGCAACCRYMVPLTAPEAHRLWHDIQALPAQRREQVLAAFTTAAKRVLAAGPPRLDGDISSANDAISRWYAAMDLRCPLLVNGACSMYAQRPISCREHHVATPAAFCAGHQPGRGRAIPLAISAAEVLRRVTGRLAGEPAEVVIMTLAPAWIIHQPQQLEQTWPAAELAAAFMSAVRDIGRK